MSFLIVKPPTIGSLPKEKNSIVENQHLRPRFFYRTILSNTTNDIWAEEYIVDIPYIHRIMS